MRHQDLHKEKTTEEPKRCTYTGCGKSFKYDWILRDHVKAVHENEFRFHCDFCENKYNTRSNLEVHIRKHFGVKPFKCNICK